MEETKKEYTENEVEYIEENKEPEIKYLDGEKIYIHRY